MVESLDRTAPQTTVIGCSVLSTDNDWWTLKRWAWLSERGFVVKTVTIVVVNVVVSLR